MAAAVKILICSDIHYAGELEQRRGNYELNAAGNWLQRWLLKLYRHFIWLRDPLAHNDLLDHVLNPPVEPDWVIANGDFSCDSAFIGVSDPAALQSAKECLGKLRWRFPGKVLPVFGDHELGKTSLCGGKGGLRLKSLELGQSELSLEPVWSRRIGIYVLAGVTSSLLALPVYERETLAEERPQWHELARQHRLAVEAVFDALTPEDRVLLFCHDPTALPFLWESESIRRRSSQIERTIIGHLHSPLFLKQSRILSGMPRIDFCGQAVRRMSSALSRSKEWRHFNILLCPSLAGLQLTREGGFYTVEIDPAGKKCAEFQFHPVRW